MRILGIDPGFAIVGYGVLDSRGNSKKAVAYGAITTPTSESFPVRLAMIDDQMTKIIREYKPDAVAVEELFFAKNVTTAINVAHARGVILNCAVRECGHLYEYTPMQIKQGLTGYGRADKNQIQQMVKLLLGLKEIPKPDDAADALAVAICHSQSNPILTEAFSIK